MNYRVQIFAVFWNLILEFVKSICNDWIIEYRCVTFPRNCAAAAPRVIGDDYVHLHLRVFLTRVVSNQDASFRSSNDIRENGIIIASLQRSIVFRTSGGTIVPCLYSCSAVLLQESTFGHEGKDFSLKVSSKERTYIFTTKVWQTVITRDAVIRGEF